MGTIHVQCVRLSDIPLNNIPNLHSTYPRYFNWTHVSSEVAPRVSIEALVVVGRLSLGRVKVSLAIDLIIRESLISHLHG